MAGSKSNDEVVRLVLDVIGQGGIDALSKSIEQNRLRLEALKMGYDAGNIKQEEYTKGTQKLAGELGRQTAMLDKLNVANGGASKSTANVGRSMLESGRIIQDFAQGGLPGILNNLEGFSSALGLGPGVAGAATALGVAFYLLGPKIEEAIKPLKDAFAVIDYGKSSVEKLQERIKELEDKKVTLAVDTLELENARLKLKEINDGLAAFDAWGKLHTDYEKKSGQAVTDIIRNARGGSDAVREQVRQVIYDEMGPGTGPAHANYAEAKAALERARENAPTRVIARRERELKKAEQEKEKADKNFEREAKEKTGAMFAGATAGDQVRVQQLAERLRRAGRGDLAEQIEGASYFDKQRNQWDKRGGATAAQIERDEALDEDVEGGVARMKGARQLREATAAEKKRKAAANKKADDEAKAALDLKLNAAGALDDERRRKQENALKDEREHMHPLVTKQLHEEDAFAKRTGLTDQAAYQQAALQANGMSGDAAYDRTQQWVQSQLQNKFGVGEEAAFGQAHRITGTARKDDKEKYDAAYSHAIAAGADVNNAMIYANNEILMTLAQANAQFAGQAGQLRSQGRRAGAMRVRSRANVAPGGAEGF